MTLGEICNRSVVVAPKTEMVVDAAKRMRTSHVGDLVIVENRGGRHVPVAVVTDRDIVVGALACDPDHIGSLLISDMMNPEIVTAQEHESIETGLKKMQQHGIRRLPIVDGVGTLVGIVTMDDVLLYLMDQQSLMLALISRGRDRERQYRF